MCRNAIIGREVSAPCVSHVRQVELVHATLIRVRHIAVLERVTDVLHRDREREMH